jgi:mRNA interferase HigB
MKRKSWFLRPSVIQGVLTGIYKACSQGSPMHIITRKRLNEFAEKHPDTESALANWYRLMKRNNASNFVELREVFPAADQVGKLTVFNVGGNKVRVIAAIHYNRRKVYLRAVLTHAEYDDQRWKE